MGVLQKKNFLRALKCFRRANCDLTFMKNMFEPQKLKHHNPQVTRKTLCLDDFEYYSYTLHSYYIYPYYLQNFKETIPKKKKKKILERFLQHIYLVRESYSSLSENSFVISSPPLSHWYTLIGDLYPNTTHTYSMCRECFGNWEALSIFQKKPVRFGGYNRAVLRNPDNYWR